MEKKSSSKTNLNESALPLLEEHDAKGETPEKEEKIELETKGGDTEKSADEEKSTEKEGKSKKKKEKKPKEPKKESTSTPFGFAQNFTVGLNVHDRDDKKINDSVNLTFEDIVGEPDANQGFEFVWRLTFLLFNWTKFWVYRLVAGLLSIPFAILWAVVFAVVSLVSVWLITPTFKLFTVLLFHVHRFWSGLVRAVLDPFFQSAGLCFAARHQPGHCTRNKGPHGGQYHQRAETATETV